MSREASERAQESTPECSGGVLSSFRFRQTVSEPFAGRRNGSPELIHCLTAGFNRFSRYSPDQRLKTLVTSTGAFTWKLATGPDPCEGPLSGAAAGSRVVRVEFLTWANRSGTL